MIRSVSYLPIAFVLSFFVFVPDSYADTLSVPGEYDTIQAAIDAAENGDIIEVGDETFLEQLNLSGKSLDIRGAGIDSTTIDASSMNGDAIKEFGDSSTVKGLTLIGTEDGYGFKISGTSDIMLENINVENSGKTGVDLNGVNGGTLTNVNVLNTAGGFGINMVDSNGIILTDITTSGNAWGGVSIQTFGKFHSGGSDNIVFNGLFNAGESGEIPLLLEQDPCDNSVGSGCINGEYFDITNVQLPDKFEYVFYGLRSPGSEDYKQWFYADTLDDAKSLATTLMKSNTYSDMLIHNLADTDAVQESVEEIERDTLYVIEGLMIQNAIDASSAGNTIEIDAGTHTLTSTLNIDKDGIEITGIGQTETIIDASGVSNYGILWTSNDVTVKDLKLLGPSADTGSSYGFKIQAPNEATEPVKGIRVTDVTVEGSGRSEIDLNFADDVVFAGVTVSGLDTKGVGIGMISTTNIEINGLVSSGNNWGSIGVFTNPSTHYVGAPPGGDVTIINLNAAEPNKLYGQGDNGGSIPSLDAPQFTHTVQNPEHRANDGDEFTYYMQSKDDAIPFALALQDPPNEPNAVSTIREFGGDFVVTPGMSIQVAIDVASSGDIINVEKGVYTPDETIEITKPVTIRGPQHSTDPRPSADTMRTIGGDEEAIIDGSDSLSAIFEILADNVTIEGLEITNGLGDLVMSDDSIINTSPVIQYNIIHDSSGDEGIQLKQVDDALIEFNHVFDTFGDGINIAFSHDSVVQSNEVHDIDSPDAAIYMYNDGTRDFINALIQDNLVYNVTNNDGIKLGDKGGQDDSLRGGNILNNVVHDTRQDSITVKTSDVLVDGNEMFNSASENGALFVDFNPDNVTITNNVIRDNGISLHSGSETNDPATTYGIRIGHDTEQATNVSVNNNIINGNEAGLFFNSQNDDNLDALRNYWGDPRGPTHSDNPDGSGDTVSDNVDFDPWYVNEEKNTLSNKIPQILSLSASDPKSPQVASFDDGDTITIRFSEPTNRPSAATKSDVDNLFEFSQDLGNDYAGTWNSPSVLVITILDSTDSTPPSVGTLIATVKESGNLKDIDNSSPQSTSTSPVLTGSFGTKSGPSITSIKAEDPDGGDAVYGDGDTITIRFSEPTNQPPVTTTSDLDALFSFSQSLGSSYSGTWRNPLTLIITINDSANNGNPQIGQLTVTVKSSANLKNTAETSLPSEATSPTLAGTFGTKPGPSITSLTANDPDGGDAVYGDGDTITVKFSEPTNEPVVATKSDVDNLLEFRQDDSTISLGDDYSGTWRNPLTLIITINDSANNGNPQIGQLTVTVKSSANLKNTAETSLPSEATSPTLAGTFGTKPGPSITSLTANDPDGGDAVYGDGDTITVRFSENTNRPSAATKSDVDNLLEFRQDGNTISLGNDYFGSWITPSVFELRILDAEDNGDPEIGQLTVTVKSSANLKNTAETSLPSEATSPVLQGNFGTRSGPSIVSLVADDPDGEDAIFSIGDTIRVRFSEETNTPPVSAKTDLDRLFLFSQSIGDNYSGTWSNTRTLVINIDDATTDDPPEIGDLTLTVRQTAGLKDSGEMSLSSTAVSPTLTGTFGTKDGPLITSIVAEDPKGTNVGYGDGDTITVKFSEPTNEPVVATKSDVDNLLEFRQDDSTISLGDDYSGTWRNPLTLIITINDSANNGNPQIGQLRITVNEDGQLLNQNENSLPSISESPALAGTFGTKPGPSITSLTANDPDGGDAVYGDGDTITVKFSEPTNEPVVATKSDVDSLFVFSQDLGTEYTGTWIDPSTLRITITDSTNSNPPEIGILTASVQLDANLKNAPNTSEPSVSISPTATGSFGDKEGPSIKSIVADDPDNNDAIFSNGDTITIRFSESTNTPDPTPDTPELTRDDIDSIFSFSQYLGDDYSGEWINPVTLRITITDSTTDESPTVGDLIAVVKEGGNLKDATETSLPSTSTSPSLSGSFGTFVEIIPVGDGGSATSTLPSGITTSVSIPAGQSNTFTVERSTTPEPQEGSRIVNFLGNSIGITPGEGNPCTEDNPCPIEFTFDSADTDAIGITPQEVRVMHDLNDDGDFDDEGEIDENTIIIQIDTTTFQASSSITSFSNFALGSTSSSSSSGGGSSDATPPSISGSTHSSLGDPSEGIGGIIGVTKELGSLKEPMTLETGQMQVFRFNVQDAGGINDIEHVSLYMNLQDNSRYASDTYIEFNKYRNPQVTIKDPNGFFARTGESQAGTQADVSVKLLQGASPDDIVIQFAVPFAKPMDTSGLILYMYDQSRSSMELKFADAIAVEPQDTEPEGILEGTGDGQDQEQTGKAEPEPGVDIWSAEQRLAIEMWAGYHPESISDYDLLNTVYFVPYGKTSEAESYDIPSWIKDDLAKWVLEEKIDFKEFIGAIKYAHYKGMLSSK